MISQADLWSCLADCCTNARNLYLPDQITYCNVEPSPLEFHREFVSKSLPCIFRNTIDHWPALKKWSPNYFKGRIGRKKVTVAVTPNGYADAVNGEEFVLPEERIMSMEEFLCLTETDKCGSDVYYIQKQDSNLTTEFDELLRDVDVEISWASEAFNKKPDAANFWMGQQRAISSLHKDPYENMYCVIKGEKTFTLYPPSERPFLPYKEFPVSRFKFVEGSWTTVKENNSKVPWIAVDPLNPQKSVYSQFSKAKAITCKVKAGEVLYLPSLWFHHVQQTNLTIAVNFWYDMEFDVKFNYYETLHKLTNLML